MNTGLNSLVKNWIEWGTSFDSAPRDMATGTMKMFQTLRFIWEIELGMFQTLGFI